MNPVWYSLSIIIILAPKQRALDNSDGHNAANVLVQLRRIVEFVIGSTLAAPTTLTQQTETTIKQRAEIDVVNKTYLISLSIYFHIEFKAKNAR